MKEWRINKELECPECGDCMEVYTDKQDNELKKYPYDGDKCKCCDPNCDFESTVMITGYGQLRATQ